LLLHPNIIYGSDPQDVELAEDCQLDIAAGMTKGWSGDDLMHLARDAAMASLRRQVLLFDSCTVDYDIPSCKDELIPCCFIPSTLKNQAKL
jgi:SpoVK/Ycf46/Vps4 family AAA+-type ATPase